MKNLSVVFFFLLAFTFSSVGVQAQAKCKPADCKKVCTKTAKATTKTAQTPAFGIVKTSNRTSSTEKTAKANCKPSNCKKVCTKANKTSVTATETKKTPTPKVVAVKQE